MLFSELPQEFQDRLNRAIEDELKRQRNDAYYVRIFNKSFTRYFTARRVCMAWGDDKGHAMPFGGGTYWVIRYGKVQFAACRDALGGRDYTWVDGKQFTSVTKADGTKVDIPHAVGTKKEVIAIIKAIGKFDI